MNKIIKMQSIRLKLRCLYKKDHKLVKTLSKYCLLNDEKQLSKYLVLGPGYDLSVIELYTIWIQFNVIVQNKKNSNNFRIMLILSCVINIKTLISTKRFIIKSHAPNIKISLVFF